MTANTMTRLDALRALLEQVEAGGISISFRDSGVFGRRNAASARHAYFGSLDAAKALHEAVLPTYIVDELSQNSRSMGWHVLICSEQGRYIYSHVKGTPFMDNPARAWLMAIIRALIAEAGE